ncbi:hypothetical protein DEU56DRAFT_748632 [Suillus clintonianus]|uniref:uncharacterized protein n=1 Tax=Suillus clintonianus TaxID=1904413 RepID=UPI001B875468|nr:uncharacterized protein DEU56DRAFT_748632 [Suillus clintonianus]KAG2115484.1 hypothetical protein DEU56DRAFT_748632 [Suillus clintonianus]
MLQEEKPVTSVHHGLTNFCEKARAHDCDFVWSNTCCIDKPSTLELDQSIRFMFKWHGNSWACVVCLGKSLDSTRAPLLTCHKILQMGLDALTDKNDKHGEDIIVIAISKTTRIPTNELIGFMSGTSIMGIL